MLRELVFAGLMLLFAQARPPAFEVASIKEREFRPGLLGVEFQPGGRVIANQAPIPLLIMAAYHILPAQLQFEPNLTKDALQAFYDIEAKPEANVIPPGALSQDNKQKLELMLQTLLVDRFKLRMHTETKELPVYALLADKGGLKLPKAPARDCEATPSPCRWFSVGARGIDGDSVTLQSLADQLSGFVGQQAFIDQTGIEDRFDIHLPGFVRDAQTPGTLVDGVPADPNAPSLATILKDVGLRLEPRKQLMDVYVVDHVEKSSSN
jgi:uncharacterized protein (TIGR03435 family)